jgi:hypothetical protein
VVDHESAAAARLPGGALGHESAARWISPRAPLKSWGQHRLLDLFRRCSTGCSYAVLAARYKARGGNRAQRQLTTLALAGYQRRSSCDMQIRHEPDRGVYIMPSPVERSGEKRKHSSNSPDVPACWKALRHAPSHRPRPGHRPPRARNTSDRANATRGTTDQARSTRSSRASSGRACCVPSVSACARLHAARWTRWCAGC